jgi:hypothetical protein
MSANELIVADKVKDEENKRTGHESCGGGTDDKVHTPLLLVLIVCYVGLNVLRLAPHSLLDLRAAAPGSK